jgi:hypothetical protein
MAHRHVTDAEFAAALAAGRTDAETEIRGQTVRYVSLDPTTVVSPGAIWWESANPCYAVKKMG